MNQKDYYTEEQLQEDMRLVQIVPHQRQIAYQDLEFLCFIHFTVNTYTGKEWGLGDEQEEIFNPVRMDARQWAKTARDGGMKGIILTCKHHDGFCLWPSKYTEHSIKNSPYKNGKGDIVREVSQACREYGLKFGIYLSPWDRNSSFYGQGDAYNDYYVNQLEELLTLYGDIFVVWLDGACGEGANGRYQSYDWDRYFEVIRRLQPDACIFGCGPDIRWCGNEAGQTRPCEWSVVPADMADAEKVSGFSQHEDNIKFRERGIDSTLMDLGSRERLKKEEQLIFYPAETNFSIRPGWFYHTEEDDKVRSFENLKDIYIKSVGGNTTMLLNLPPTPEGLIHENDVAVVEELGKFIQEAFADNIAPQAHMTSVPAKDVNGNTVQTIRTDTIASYFENPAGERELEIVLEWETERELNYLVLKEAIQFSQRVERFTVFCEKNIQTPIFEGTVIGRKKIIPLHGIKTKKLSIQITDARVAPILAFVGVYEKQAEKMAEK